MKNNIVKFLTLGFLGLLLTACTDSVAPPATVIPPAVPSGGPATPSVAPVGQVSGSDVKPDDSKLLSAAKNAMEDETTVTLNVDNVGRKNPFSPFVQKNIVASGGGDLPMINVGASSLPVPPSAAAPDPNLTALNKAKVGGILYDPKSVSSAIITVNGEDYLVHKGDHVLNYFIKAITPTEVVVAYGRNEIRAKIGEILDGTVHSTPVSYAVKTFGAKQPHYSDSDSTFTFTVK